MGSQKVNGIIRIPVRWNPNYFFCCFTFPFCVKKILFDGPTTCSLLMLIDSYAPLIDGLRVLFLWTQCWDGTEQCHVFSRVVFGEVEHLKPFMSHPVLVSHMQSHSPPAMNLSSAAIICVLKPNIKIPMKAPDFISDDGTATIVGKCIPRIFRILHAYARYVHM